MAKVTFLEFRKPYRTQMWKSYWVRCGCCQWCSLSKVEQQCWHHVLLQTIEVWKFSLISRESFVQIPRRPDAEYPTQISIIPKSLTEIYTYQFHKHLRYAYERPTGVLSTTYLVPWWSRLIHSSFSLLEPEKPGYDLARRFGYQAVTLRVRDRVWIEVHKARKI